MATKYHGKKGVVYASTSASGSASQVATLSEWTLNMATDKVEVTCFGNANKTYVQGLKDLSGTLSGYWDSDTDSLFDAADSTDGLKLYLYPSSDAASLYFYGPAWLDMSINTAVNGAVTMSGNFVANGSWGRQ